MENRYFVFEDCDSTTSRYLMELGKKMLKKSEKMRRNNGNANI